eukprot:Em0003g926a
MRTFGATWKQARIEGVVVEKPKKNCRRVKWTIGSETCVSDHSVAFWKKLSQQQVVTPPVTSPDIAAFPDGLTGEEEPDEHQRERTLLEDEPDELDVSEAISTLGQGVTEQDPLCAHGQKWSLLEGGVTQCQRAKDGWLQAREVVEPGTECIIDESMGMWKPIFENTPEGIPSLRKIARKTQGIGIEYKNLADAETGIILHLEIQEAADIMAKKAYCDRYPKSVALVLRLTEMLHGSGRVIHGDSAFASVACCTALLEHGLYFSGLLKTAHKEFPKKYCQDIAFQAGAQRGDTVTICTTKAIGSATKFIYGHVWNEPGSEGTLKKIIVSTWNHTLPVDDHIKKRWRLNPVSGESETIMRTVPRTQMIKSYFSAACAIDVHNHLRQDGLGLEHSVQTKDWWFCMFCTILGIIEVDAFKVFCSFNVHTKQPPHSVFTENLVIACLTNTRPGAPVATKHIMELRKRRRQDDEEDTVYQNDVQQIRA